MAGERLAVLRRVLAVPIRILGTKTVSTLQRFRYLCSVPIGKYCDLRNKVTAVSFHIFSRSFMDDLQFDVIQRDILTISCHRQEIN